MSNTEVLVDAFGRVRAAVADAVEGLNREQLAFRIDAQANSIAWLVWHLTRIQDDHIADAAQNPQVWTEQDWVDRFALPFDERDTGFGHAPEEIAEVRVDGDLLIDYHDAVHDQTQNYLARVDENEFGRIVDASWTPVVTVGVRLVSVFAEGLQHAGQAAYIKGIVLRR